MKKNDRRHSRSVSSPPKTALSPAAVAAFNRLDPLLALCATPEQRTHYKATQADIEERREQGGAPEMPRPPEHPGVPSIEERLRVIRDKAVLIEASLRAITDPDLSAYDADDYGAAAIEEIRTIHEEAFYLAQLPADVLNMKAPTPDQAETIAQQAGGTQEHIDANSLMSAARMLVRLAGQAEKGGTR